MSEFSNLLEQYAVKSSYSHVQLAKICGIDRSLFMKFCHGTRKPQSVELVKSIADNLMLTARERTELMEAYDILRLGKTVYYQRKSVNELIEQFSELAENELLEVDTDEVSCNFSEASINTINGRVNVIAFLQKFLFAETSKPQCEIKLFMPSRSSDIMMLLKGICIRKNVSIRQIIGLSQMREESEKNNVWQLLDMIPLLFGTCEYEARYYYENQVMESAFETPLSSCMIVNDYCLTFNADLKNLIIYREEEVHQIYSEYFEKIWKENKEFAKHMNEVSTIFQVYDTKDYICVQGVPCLALGFTRHFLESIADFTIEENMGLYLDYYMERINGLKDCMKKEGKLSFVIVTSKNGIVDFMERGFLGEFPAKYHKIPVPERDRYRLLRTLVSQMKNGYLDCRINKEERLKIDRRIQVDLISHKNIFLSDTKEGKEFGYTIITENSVVSAFCDYIENYLFEELVYSKEESIRILEEMIERYEEKK